MARRLIEESELFAKLVADDRSERAPPEKLPKLLQAIDAMPEDLGTTPASTPGLRKWLVVAGAALFLPAGVVAVTFARNDAPPRASASSTTSVSVSSAATSTTHPAPMATPEEPRREVVPAVAVTGLPDVPPSTAPNARAAVSHVAHGASAPAAASASAARPSLRREVELIVAARRALSGGDANGCLSSVGVYQSEYPNGQFALEAKVMRIEALAASGERSRAAILARELLERDPKNPYEQRLRSLLTNLEGR